MQETTATVDDIVNDKNYPKDAKIMAILLKSMGVEEFEPAVINQMLEFMHKYTSEVFQDALVYSQHANKQVVEFEDIVLATQSRANSFSQPPPRELLLQLASTKNFERLELIPNKFGVILPPNEYCLNAPNYQIESLSKKL